MPSVNDIESKEWNAKVMEAEGPVVVDFWHPMCGWCLQLNPIYEQLPERIEGVSFYKMNVLESTENRQVAMDFGVMGTPTIKVICQGRDIGEIVGFRPIDGLVDDIKEILSKKDECLAKSTPLE